MKQQFIDKWKSWWMLQKQGVELTDAFERELNAIIEQEVASKNLIKANPYTLVWYRADWSKTKTEKNNAKYWEWEIMYNEFKCP